MKLIALLLVSLLSFPAYATGNHHKKPDPVVSSDGSSSNALTIAVVIAAGICIYHRCWQKKPVQDNDPHHVTPTIPKNEYTYTIKP